MFKRSKTTFLVCFILSLLFIHAPLIFWFYWADWHALDNLMATLPQKPVLMLNLKDGQKPLVDLDKPAKEEVPENPSAYAQYNMKVKEERTGRGGGTKSATPKQKKPVAKKVKQTKTKTPGKGLPKPEKAGESQPTEKVNLQDALAKLDLAHQKKEDELQQLFISKNEENFKMSFQGGGDFVPYYKVGDRTYVNAIAHPSVSYYAEMKSKFRLAWDPQPVVRAHVRELSHGAIRVVWGMTVDADGKLLEMKRIQASPLRAYDSEARRTIRVSAPFSPPPKHLLSSDGKLYVAWGFVVFL